MKLDYAPDGGGFLAKGARVWLSGAVPLEATEAQRCSMLEFVRRFADAVFQGGGHILHGSHPSFTPTLLQAAEEYRGRSGRRDCLNLVVSKSWSKDSDLIAGWRKNCLVHETPEASGESARDESLIILRRYIAERCDAFVAVGGLGWREVAGRAGVPLETELAIERGLPCFLLGGLGGAAQDYIRTHQQLVRVLRNGLDDLTNAKFATCEDAAILVECVCGQLSRLPLLKGRAVEGHTFRILALDGGGIKGAYAASVLATLSKQLDEPIARRFDLIAGTSTGGILAIGLGLGMTPAEILDFYRRMGPAIFPMMRAHQRIGAATRHWFKPKHSQEVLLDSLKSAYFPDGVEKRLSDSICRLVVPTFDAISGVCHTFRTPHHEFLSGDASINVANVALATAAAPTYYSAAKVKNGISNTSYFDGGVWANCPALAAVMEAVVYLQVPLDRIDVLSVGTTDESFSFKSKINAGIASWGRKLFSLLMTAQTNAVVDHAQNLVGAAKFLRINTTTSEGLYPLDNTREIESLIALGNKEASNPGVLSQVKSRFLNGIEVIDWRRA